MIAKNFISNIINPLSLSDTGAIALSWMDDYKTKHLPLVENNDLIGIVSEQEIFEMSDFDASFSDLNLSLEKFYVQEYQHFFDVFKTISQNKISILPVLDEKLKYIGSIDFQQLINRFSETTSMNNPGGVIVLEMSLNDYSASEISQIVETNNAKILSMFVTSHNDSTKLEVSLKINKIEIGPIIQTFNRYDYIIKASYMEDEDFDDLKERYDSFMKYLSI